MAEQQTPEPISDDRFPDASDGPGASDSNSGGGSGSGVPDAETAIRAGDPVTRGNTKHDREKLFPESMPENRGRGQPASD